MVCSVYFGSLNQKRKLQWNITESNPFDVLDSPIKLDGKGHELLQSGAKYFTDQIQIDWGSYSWKCIPDDIYRFLEDHKSTLPWLIKSEEELIQTVQTYISERPNDEFGIVFIEES